MHVSILDHIQHLNFELLMSLKVKRDGGFEHPYMIFYWCLIATYGLPKMLYER